MRKTVDGIQKKLARFPRDVPRDCRAAHFVGASHTLAQHINQLLRAPDTLPTCRHALGRSRSRSTTTTTTTRASRISSLRGGPYTAWILLLPTDILNKIVSEVINPIRSPINGVKLECFADVVGSDKAGRLRRQRRAALPDVRGQVDCGLGIVVV